ncbi:fibronectin type III domain-containing protein [Roseivirga echinicomitans]
MKRIEKKSRVLKMISYAFLLTILFSVNACKDDDSQPNSVTAPTVNAATEIAATSFKVSWTAVNGADKYLLDVSTDAQFGTKVTGFDKKEITTTSATITGLTKKTKYHCRVYAKKGTSTSVPSAVKTATTIE